MFKLLKNLRVRDYFYLLISIVLVVASVYLELRMPDYMSDITVLINTSTSAMKDIWIAGLKMLGCALGSALITAITSAITTYVATNFAKTIRSKLYDKVEQMSNYEIDDFSTASLITRTTNDVTQVQNTLAMGLVNMFKAPTLAIWAIVKIVGKGSTGWVVATGTVVGLLVLLLSILIALCLPKFKKIQKQTDEVNKISRENITGLRVIKAFNAEDFQNQKFEKVNSDLTKTNVFTGVWMSLMSPFMTILMSGLSLSIYWIGAYAINKASASDKLTLFANMIVFSQYAMQVVMAFMLLIIIFMVMPRAMVSAKRINEVLDKKLVINEGSFVEEPETHGELEFKNVTFAYDNDDKTDQENVLTNISFRITEGKTLAIIGATGSGKTTIVNLASRFYDPSEGEVLLDGVNVKDYNFVNMYNRLALVPQKATMFQGTIKDNILYGESNNNDQDALEKAINVSKSKEYIDKTEKGLESPVEQMGKNMSGGQKQRISIARALVRNPEIIIFDDSFSALDYKTDFALRRDLNKEYKNITKIIVAQRIGTIKDADQIIVLDEGKIVGIGTHKELLKNCPTYYEIALSQLTKEEIENA